MNISYKYDKNTGAYVGGSIFTIDQFGDPIVSKYETVTEPMSGAENKIARYLDIDGNVPTNCGANGAEWFLHDDYKDQTYYNQNGSSVVISEYNVTPPTGTLLIDPPNKYYKTHDGADWIYDSTDHIIDRVDEVKALEVQRYSIDTAYTYDGTEYEWQVDEDSQDNIVVGTSVAMMSSIDATNFPWEGDDKDWCSSDNTMVTFATPLDFLQFAKSMQVHCRAIWKTAKIHKTAIRSLTDETEINNYDITTGW